MIETSGNPAAQAKAIEFLRVEGTTAMIGLGSSVASIAPAQLFRRQLTVYGSNLYPKWMLPEIIAFVRRRQVPLDRDHHPPLPARRGPGRLPPGQLRHHR